MMISVLDTMNAAYKTAKLILIGLFALPTAVLAKRMPAPVVEPIVHNGVRYTVPNDKGTRGYVVAWDASTDKQLWKKTIFRKCICPFFEHDVQWVFIKQMRLEDGRLIIVNERDKVYSLDLKTRKVKKLKDQTGTQKGPNQPAAGNAGIGLWWQLDSHLPGVPEPGRSGDHQT